MKERLQTETKKYVIVLQAGTMHQWLSLIYKGNYEK